MRKLLSIGFEVDTFLEILILQWKSCLSLNNEIKCVSSVERNFEQGQCSRQQ